MSGANRGKLPSKVSSLLDALYDHEIETYTPSKKLLLGRLYLFVYDAKYKNDKKRLPYWDALPLVVLLKWGNGYMHGLNIHYIPWTFRIQFVREIFNTAKKKANIDYDDIKKAWQKAKVPRAFAYLAYRTYILHPNHIKTNVKMFDSTTWEGVTKQVLPQFQREQDTYIYKEINRKVSEQRRKLKGP